MNKVRREINNTVFVIHVVNEKRMLYVNMQLKMTVLNSL